MGRDTNPDCLSHNMGAAEIDKKVKRDENLHFHNFLFLLENAQKSAST